MDAPVGQTRELVRDAVRVTTAGITTSVAARRGTHPLEEDLRRGLASALAACGALVLTEAHLPLRGWTPNLGGFDFAIVGENGDLTVGETKWTDGRLWQAMWDVLKLASATTLPRVTAGYAVYGAPVEQWKAAIGADLFANSAVVSDFVIEENLDAWEKNLKGSTAYPTELPERLSLELVAAEQMTAFDRTWEVRAVSVTAFGPSIVLEHGRLPAELPPPPR